MKKYKPYYSESSVTYWPTYNAGIGLIVCYSIIFTMLFSVLFWSYLDSVTKQERISYIVFLSIITIIALLIFKFILKAMFVKITVTHSGIEYINYAKECKQISWTQVSKVYFHLDTWRGTKTCRIYTDSLVTQIMGKGAKEYFVLPIQEVDEKQLLLYIPKQLWKNDPKNVFFAD